MKRKAPSLVSLKALSLSVLLVLAATGLSAQDLPRPVGRVNDFANVISSSEEQEIERVILSVEQATPAEIAVVTVESMQPYATIEQYGIALADQWQVGSADDDSGVILILALAERQVRIEVGFGLEGALPDGRAGGILDEYVVPDFRDGNYGAGMLNGVVAVASVIAEEYGVTLSLPAIETPASEPESSFDLGNLIYLVFVLLAFGGRFFFWPLLFAGRRRGFYGGGFGTGRGFSSGGSSFGGFGGGGFGGGGASRGF